MPETIRMLLITDAGGKVIAAAPAGPAHAGSGHGIAIAPLPGQAVHEADVPADLARMLQQPGAHDVLARFVLEPAGTRLREIPVTIRRAHHD